MPQSSRDWTSSLTSLSTLRLYNISLTFLRSPMLANAAMASSAKFRIFSFLSPKSLRMESNIWYESNSFGSLVLRKHLISKCNSSSRICQLELLFKQGKMRAMKLLSFLLPDRMISLMPNKHFIASYLIMFLLSANFFTINGMCLVKLALLSPQVQSQVISDFSIFSNLSLYQGIQIKMLSILSVLSTILKF